MGDHDHADHGHGHTDHGCCDDENCHSHKVHDDCCDHGHQEHGHQEHDHGHAAPPFDAEAFGGVDLVGDGGLYKKILVEGDAEGGSPSPGSKVKVHYVGTLLDGSKFDSSRDRPGFFEFNVGIGQVIQGWDKGICTMRKGEKCILACRSDYAYGKQGSPPKIPPDATLLFEVELFSWKEKRKEKFEMTATERIEMAEQLKAEGTKLFKNGKFEDALESYEDGTGYIGSDFDDFDIPADQEAQAKACYISCRLNGAQCALKLQENAQAVELCSHVLEKDPGSLKALFRRGTARMHMGEWANAKADFKAANEIDPKSKEVREAFAEVARKEAESKKKEKALYGKMFG